MACGFEVTDCFGRTVRLSHANWQTHIRKRPEIEKYHDLLPEVLVAPALVIEAPRTGDHHFYRREFPSLSLQSVWLRVAVVYDDADGWVASAWLSKRVAPGVQRWPKL
jgi:hypothetical protein